MPTAWGQSEEMLRLLNGGHSSLAYVSYLLGHRTTDELWCTKVSPLN